MTTTPNPQAAAGSLKDTVSFVFVKEQGPEDAATTAIESAENKHE